ncbi:hypothetical protein [Bacteroides faecichinchillae]|uniref:hypothetical protein n=1 Tax=Bacteroides faecichinchillae TaxID=871325 RepID=UPI0011DCD37B|nr:hypothetical protein [Bacteroides faecichinchillae]
MRTKVAMIACMFVVSMVLSSCNHSKQSSNSKMEDNKMKNEVVTSNEPLFGWENQLVLILQERHGFSLYLQ